VDLNAIIVVKIYLLKIQLSHTAGALALTIKKASALVVLA
jgi:hypothetical protein